MKKTAQSFKIWADRYKARILLTSTALLLGAVFGLAMVDTFLKLKGKPQDFTAAYVAICSTVLPVVMAVLNYYFNRKDEKKAE